MKKPSRHDGSPEHALEQVTALCCHAICRADEYVQNFVMDPDQHEALAEQLIDHGAHLQLTITMDMRKISGVLRVIEQGTPKFPDALLEVSSLVDKAAEH